MSAPESTTPTPRADTRMRLPQTVRAVLGLAALALGAVLIIRPTTLVSILTALALTNDPEVFRTDPTSGPLEQRLRENIPPARGDAPLLIGQGASDSLITATAQQSYVDQLCAAGRDVDFRLYDGLDHIPLVENGSPALVELFDWTRQRIAGEQPSAACGVAAG